MTDVTRRVLLAGAGALGATLAEEGARACSLVARQKPRVFSDDACRRSLGDLIALIGRAPSWSDADLRTRTADLSITFDRRVIDPIMDYANRGPIEDADLIRAWGVSGGRRDRRPIALAEISLLKQGKGVALYQFTLRRDRFYPEVTEEEADSCGGAFPAHFSRQDSSYLGIFRNNRLRRVDAFDAWLDSF